MNLPNVANADVISHKQKIAEVQDLFICKISSLTRILWQTATAKINKPCVVLHIPTRNDQKQILLCMHPILYTCF